MSKDSYVSNSVFRKDYISYLNSVDHRIAKIFSNEAGMLNLNDTGFTDYDCAVLSDVLHCDNSIKILNLANNNISDAGVIRIVQGLKNNTSLEEISLSNNYIGLEGAEALAYLLRHNHTIKSILLFNNHLGNFGAEALLAALQDSTRSEHGVTIENLYLEKNGIGANIALKLLAFCIPRHISLHSILRLDQEGIERIKNMGTEILAGDFDELSSSASLSIRDKSSDSMSSENILDSLDGNLPSDKTPLIGMIDAEYLWNNYDDNA